MFAIEARGLSKKFGNYTAVDNIDLAVTDGEIFGFLGANGAGKTTTIKMLIGLLQPTSGSIYVSGVDVIRYSHQVKTKIGYMSQKFSLYSDLTVEENIDFYGGIYGLSSKTVRSSKEKIISEFGLEDFRKFLTRDLPLGLKQRLALGISLMHQPKVVFLDEPTSGTDPISRRNFWKIIQDLSKQGITVFVTTHYLQEAEYCSKISLIDSGKIVVTGAPSELKREVITYPIYELDFGSIENNLIALNKCSNLGELLLFGNKLHFVPREIQNDIGSIGKIFVSVLGFKPIFIRQIVPTLEDVFVKLVQK